MAITPDTEKKVGEQKHDLKIRHVRLAILDLFLSGAPWYTKGRHSVHRAIFKSESWFIVVLVL